jgi:tRNA-specific 2-thiouridylase
LNGTASHRIVVALSGGVDSATAAALLVEAGHDVVGITMRLYDARGTESSSGGRCCGPRDIEDARAVCAHLGIPFYVASYEAEFAKAVVDDFASEYARGRTPNPCVKCNEQIKFSPLLKRARALGAAKLATGHFARIDGGRLRRAVDESKDQSYFLFAMPGLEDIVFPLGGMTKTEVRGHAARLGLPNAEKPESMEICFVPDGDHAKFVASRVGAAPGEIVSAAGEVVGKHDGVHRFTVGQRRGLGVAAGEPQYVVAVDALTRRVTIGSRELLRREKILVEDVRWIGGRPSATFTAGVQVRHRAKPASARIVPETTGATVEFETPPDGACAPGQAAVFYDGDTVVGGGWIA